jgi:hypothetical protein
VQILVDAALLSIFPEECNTWQVAMKNARERLQKDLTERQNKVCDDLARQEASLQCILRDAVVEDVMERFP